MKKWENGCSILMALICFIGGSSEPKCFKYTLLALFGMLLIKYIGGMIIYSVKVGVRKWKNNHIGTI